MSEPRLVSADRMVELARHAYNEWNLAMAAAEGNRQINKCFKMQELCEAVESVVKAAPTIDPETLPIVQELREKIEGLYAEIAERDKIYGEQYHAFHYWREREAKKRSVEVPCNIGEHIWVISKYGLIEACVTMITIGTSAGVIVNAEARTNSSRNFGFNLRLKDFGEIAFLTREEAEAALKERESNA